MAMDDTDKRLVKGLVWLVVFASLAYFFPGFWFLPGGYKQQKLEEATQRDRLKQSGEKFRRYYRPLHPAHFGDFSVDPVPDPPGTPVRLLKEQYAQGNTEIQQLIELKEKASRMSFPDWTKVPEIHKRNPGVHFMLMWQRKQNSLNTEWNQAKVECADSEIGFKRFSGLISTWDENKTEEMLRELCIAERIIQLCINAKLHQEKDEKANNFAPEAYMRIISVTPDYSTTTGPSSLLPNLKYNPEERNPASERFRKYNVKPGQPFIQEYPVEIVLQCDINSFMRFLHAVRSPGQFLVIRNLDIFSPFLDDSLYDKAEMEARDLQTDPNELEKKLKIKDEHVIVRMSAAGMDFFDPIKNKHGLYEAGRRTLETPTGTKKQRVLPAGP